MSKIICILIVHLLIYAFPSIGSANLNCENLRPRNRARDQRNTQRNQPSTIWDLGVSFGTSHALTDIGGTGISAQFSFFDAQPTATSFQGGGFIRNRLSDLFALETTLIFARIGAADSLSPPNSGRFPRGYHFQNNLLEMSLQANLYLPKSILNIPPEIYAFSGIGFLLHAPQLKNRNDDILPVGDVSSPQHVVPIGLGIHYTNNFNLIFGFRTGFRLTFSDTIDGYDAFHGKNDDSYLFNSFSIGYRIGN